MSRVLGEVKPNKSPSMTWELMRRAKVHHPPAVEERHVFGI
ncbi:hypothetical protein ACIHFD_57025 [Nonomuraea sp. NPDC051941]